MENELILLPFDHRSSFARDILGVKKLNKSQEQEIKSLKKIIFDGFTSFLSTQEKKDSLGILVDEYFGEDIIRISKQKKIITSIPVEKSGETEFTFEYEDFEEHIDKFKPEFVKVLWKYSSANDNKTSFKRLYKLGQFCEKNHYKLIFELLIPSKEKRLEETIKAIKELKNFIKVYIWKMEGYTTEEWQQISLLMNKKERIIVLGRGEDKEKVEEWLKHASKIDKIIGFAVGRTIFLQVLKDFYNKKLSREEAVEIIKNNLEYFVNIWRKEKLGA
jgi:5-dehydro-2-deoxygluconokinase